MIRLFIAAKHKALLSCCFSVLFLYCGVSVLQASYATNTANDQVNQQQIHGDTNKNCNYDHVYQDVDCGQDGKCGGGNDGIRSAPVLLDISHANNEGQRCEKPEQNAVKQDANVSDSMGANELAENQNHRDGQVASGDNVKPTDTTNVTHHIQGDDLDDDIENNTSTSEKLSEALTRISNRGSGSSLGEGGWKYINAISKNKALGKFVFYKEATDTLKMYIMMYLSMLNQYSDLRGNIEQTFKNTSLLRGTCGQFNIAQIESWDGKFIKTLIQHVENMKMRYQSAMINLKKLYSQAEKALDSINRSKKFERLSNEPYYVGTIDKLLEKIREGDVHVSNAKGKYGAIKVKKLSKGDQNYADGLENELMKDSSKLMMYGKQKNQGNDGLSDEKSNTVDKQNKSIIQRKKM